MNPSESELRHALRTLAEEAPVVTELAESKPRRGGSLIPLLAVGITAAVVLAIVLVTRDALPQSDDVPASNPGQQIQVDSVSIIRPSGIVLYTSLTSKTPMRVTGTSLDPEVVATRSEGYIWDNQAPDPDIGFDHVDISGSKRVSLIFTVLPRCADDTDWSQIDISVDTSDGAFTKPVEAPMLPDLVSEWCGSPMQVEAGSGSASQNWCEVTRDFDFTNPAARAATIRLTTPGWQAEPLTFKEGQIHGTMVIRSDQACDLPKDPTQLIVTYEDGSTETIRGPSPLQNL